MIQRLSQGGKVVETSSAEAVFLISSGQEPLDGILICFNRISKQKGGILFVSVPKTGRILLEFVFSFDSQNLGRVWRYCGRPQKPVHVVEVFSIKGFSILVTM